MKNDTQETALYFGNVAFPFSLEEALCEGASYRPDKRKEEIRKTISEIKEYFKKYNPNIKCKQSGDGSAGDIDELIKLLLEIKFDKKADVTKSR